MWEGAPARNCAVVGRAARVQAGVGQGEESKKWAVFGPNVTTLQRGHMPTSRRSGQRRDVPDIGTKQRRDVGYQRRDVLEMFKFNVATFQRV